MPLLDALSLPGVPALLRWGRIQIGPLKLWLGLGAMAMLLLLPGPLPAQADTLPKQGLSPAEAEQLRMEREHYKKMLNAQERDFSRISLLVTAVGILITVGVFMGLLQAFGLRNELNKAIENFEHSKSESLERMRREIQEARELFQRDIDYAEKGFESRLGMQRAQLEAFETTVQSQERRLQSELEELRQNADKLQQEYSQKFESLFEAFQNDRLMSDAIAEMQKANYSTALRYLERILDKAPGNARAWYNKGFIHQQRGDQELALMSFKQSLQIKSEQAAVWNSKGEVEHEIGHLETALKSFQQALELNSQFADACVNRAKVLLELDRPAKALREVDHALEVNGNMTHAWYTKAQIHARLNQEDELISALTTAIQQEESYRLRARQDTRFEPYWEKDAFQALMTPLQSEDKDLG